MRIKKILIICIKFWFFFVVLSRVFQANFLQKLFFEFFPPKMDKNIF